MYANNRREPDLNGARGKLLAAGLVAFGVIAVSAYGFAAGDQPRPATVRTVSTNEIRTTPDNAGQREMPPPVAPTKTE